MIGRRPKVPEEVKSQLKLGAKERVLAWVDDGHGRFVVASETALHLQRNPPAYSRYSWDKIEQARYDAGVMTIVLTPELESATLRIPVGEGRELPVVVRDRVTSSVVVDRFVAVDGDLGARIVARRGDDGALTWRLDLDPALTGNSQAVRQAESLLEEVKSEILMD